MRLLFVKPQLIGDTLILTPTLQAVRETYPEAEIWVLIRRGCEGILADCPAVDHVLTIAAANDKKVNLRTIRDGIRDVWRLRRVRFDFVIELSDHHRGRLFATLARARQRYTLKTFGKLNRWERWRFTAQSTYESELKHRVERDFYSTAEFLPLKAKSPGPLVFGRSSTRPWPEGSELKRYCLLQIGTWKDYSRWPRERWREVAAWLLDHFDHLVISTGPSEREVSDAKWMREELGPRLICTFGETSWAQVAGLLYGAELYVGLDTAAMHLATACGCPVVAIYTTTEERWLPWQATSRVVLPESYRAITDPVLLRKYRREPKTLEITTQDVIAACREMLRAKTPA